MVNKIIAEIGKIIDEENKKYICVKKIFALEKNAKIETLNIIRNMGLETKFRTTYQMTQREIDELIILETRLDQERKSRKLINFTG